MCCLVFMFVCMVAYLLVCNCCCVVVSCLMLLFSFMVYVVIVVCFVSCIVVFGVVAVSCWLRCMC